MTEIDKSMNHLNQSLVWEFHEKKHVSYDLKIQNLCKLPQVKTQGYGQESLSFRLSQLGNTLNTLDDSVKNEPTLLAFNRGSKTRLVINVPVKYATYFCIRYIFSSVNSWFELVFT